jgi:hypothetical protein
MPRKKVQPTVQQAVAEQPTVQQAVAEQPIVEQPVVEQPVVEQPVVAEKKKRVYNRKKVIEAEAPQVAETPKVAEVPQVDVPKAKPIKLKTPRAKKILPTEVLLPQVQVVEKPADLVAKFVEVVAPPITITDFVVVKVKKLKSQGKDYYYDECSGKVYGISVNGVGAYKGRYKEEDDIVDTTFPDSDDE